MSQAFLVCWPGLRRSLVFAPSIEQVREDLANLGMDPELVAIRELHGLSAWFEVELPLEIAHKGHPTVTDPPMSPDTARLLGLDELVDGIAAGAALPEGEVPEPVLGVKLASGYLGALTQRELCEEAFPAVAAVLYPALDDDGEEVEDEALLRPAATTTEELSAAVMDEASELFELTADSEAYMRRLRRFRQRELGE